MTPFNPPSAEFADLIAGIEATLNQSFKGKTIQDILSAVNSRIDELKLPAQLEPAFDEHSLERGILKNLRAQLTGMGGVPGTSHTSH